MLEDQLKIGFFQMDVVRRSKQANFRKIKQAISEVCLDLLVLPELFNVGYLFESNEQLFDLAEFVPDGETTQGLMQLAKDKQCNILGGIAEKDQSILYNTAVLIRPDGKFDSYRKIHLSKYEKQFFTAGDAIGLFDLDGIKIGVQICFDAWFPEISRQQMLQGAELICYCANFGGPSTPQIVKARAMENMIFAVLCNRVGAEKNQSIDAEFLGRSVILDPQGQMLCAEVEKKEYLEVVEIFPEKSRAKSSAMCDNLLEEVKIHYSLQTRKKQS
jgi:predicted amidohydrolase